MRRLIATALLATSLPALSGCIPMMAFNAATTIAQMSQRKPVSNQSWAPVAWKQCEAQAAQYGTVHVIDVEQHRIDKIIVWGTVDDGKEKRSFECDFGTKITGFKLRAITPATY
jgi:hypothetical protein